MTAIDEARERVLRANAERDAALADLNGLVDAELERILEAERNRRTVFAAPQRPEPVTAEEVAAGLLFRSRQGYREEGGATLHSTVDGDTIGDVSFHALADWINRRAGLTEGDG